jgi:anti-sigma factor RsiW
MAEATVSSSAAESWRQHASQEDTQASQEDTNDRLDGTEGTHARFSAQSKSPGAPGAPVGKQLQEWLTARATTAHTYRAAAFSIDPLPPLRV